MIEFPSNSDDLSPNGLFSIQDDYEYNTIIWKSNRWYAYAEGYKVAADIIIDNFLENKEYRDMLIFPIVFLYRQSIELYLKYIIKQGALLLRDSTISIPTHHDLNRLWLDTQGILKKIMPEITRSEYSKIYGYIREFAKNDPKSMSFRYPVDKRGKLALNNITHINAKYLKESLDELFMFLDGVSSQMDYYIDSID